MGYPGIGGINPFFGFGMSPLAVENALFERTILGRRTPAYRPVTGTSAAARAAATAPVGTGTFQPPQ